MRPVLWGLIFILLGITCYRRYKQGKLMSVMITLAVMAVSVVVGLSLFLFLFQSRILYQPSHTIYMTPDDVGLKYEQVKLNTPDGQTLSAWYVPAEDTDRTVLFCHGNAGNISHRLATLEMFHKLGLNCLIVDYRGYGQSTGKPTEEGTLIDIMTGWDWLIEQKGTSPEQIILFGRSLGGSIAAIVASDIHPAALVIESAFTSYDDMAAHLYPFLPVRLFTRFDYNTLEAVKEVTCPLLVIHSPDDEIIPCKFGRQLYEAANEPKQFAELAGTHNEGFYENAAIYGHIWQNWLRQLPTGDGQ